MFFQPHDVNRSGRVLLKRRMMCDQLLEAVAQVDRRTIVVDACAGAQARIVSRPYVKSSVPRQQNNSNDVEAIVMVTRGNVW